MPSTVSIFDEMPRRRGGECSGVVSALGALMPWKEKASKSRHTRAQNISGKRHCYNQCLPGDAPCNTCCHPICCLKTMKSPWQSHGCLELLLFQLQLVMFWGDYSHGTRSHIFSSFLHFLSLPVPSSIARHGFFSHPGKKL